jgi:putative transposase
VDHDGEVLEAFVTKKRDKSVALKFLKKLMRRHGRAEGIVTDGLRSQGAALKGLGAEGLQVAGRRASNRAGNSHQPFRRRERAMSRFRRLHSLQPFVSVHNLFNTERSRADRKQARTAGPAEWRQLCAS